MTPLDTSVLNAVDDPDELLQKVRHALVNRVWYGLMFVALIGMPISVLRAVSTGWLPLYTIHAVLALLVVCGALFRARMSYAIKAALLVAIFASVGLGGLFTLGLLGASIWWLAMTSLLVGTIYSPRAGVASAMVVTVMVAIAAYCFTTGRIAPAVDANAYVAHITSWINVFIAIIMTPYVLFRAISAYQYTTVELLRQVHTQHEEIARLATHDQLTGLLQLNLANDRLHMALEAARRSGRRVALLFLDLDGFKSVNDSFGHEAGDMVLKEVSQRLLSSIRAGDTAARIGGDEFILVLGSIDATQEAAEVAERVIRNIAEPVMYHDHVLNVGISIGIGIFPDHAGDVRSLRKVSDAAMYRVKRAGKNGFRFAGPEAAASADGGRIAE